MDSRSKLCAAQGAFYLATGVWPLVSRRSFEMVTGPKTDFWLVKTVGVLVAAIGGTLLAAGRRGRVTPEIAGLAVGTAAGFATLDAWYVGRGRISHVYLLDALAEAALIAMWSGTRAAVDERRAPIASV